MDIDEDFQRFARDSREFQGRVLASLDNLHNYIVAVNANVKSLSLNLGEHISDNEAHGLGVREKSWRVVVQWLSIVISLGVLAKMILAKGRP